MMTRAEESLSRLSGRLLIFVWAALLLGATGAKAEPAITPVKTMVQDILYRADGTVAHGMLTIRWSAFSTSAGQAVPSGELTTTIGADGSISIPLIPNTGSSPSGSYYRVFLKLDDELKAHMRWIVGNGNEGKIQELETRIQKHEAALQRAAGLGVAAGILMAIVHLALESMRAMHH